MSNEKPTASREDLNTAESTAIENIAQKKQEIASALEAGDYVSVAVLAQEARDMETAKGEMVNEAHGEAIEDNEAEEVKDAERAEQERLQVERDEIDKTKVMARLGMTSTETAPVEQAAEVTAGHASVEESQQAPEIAFDLHSKFKIRERISLQDVTGRFHYGEVSDISDAGGNSDEGVVIRRDASVGGGEEFVYKNDIVVDSIKPLGY